MVRIVVQCDSVNLLMESIVVSFIGIKLLMISIVVQCIWNEMTYDKHSLALNYL